MFSLRHIIWEGQDGWKDPTLSRFKAGAADQRDEGANEAMDTGLCTWGPWMPSAAVSPKVQVVGGEPDGKRLWQGGLQGRGGDP